MIIDLIATLGGMIIPPAFDFIKKKFVKGGDSAQSTLNTLAITKPEYVGEFISSQGKLLEAEKKFFNRDVIGEASRWVVDLRASIRPLCVCACLGLMIYCTLTGIELDTSLKVFMELNISSWFGSRLTR